MAPNDDETTRALTALSDEELLDRLLHAGLDVPPGLPQELVRRGPAVVAPLSAWVRDDGLWGTEDDVACWAPVHALHLLGAIGDPAAIPAVIGVARRTDPDEPVHDGLACVLASFGPAVIGAARELLHSWPEEGAPTTWADVVRGLVIVGRDHPDERPSVAGVLVEMLSDPACDGDERTAWAVAELVAVPEPEVVAAVDAALERGAAGWVVDREWVQDQRAGQPAPWSVRRGLDAPLDWFSERSLRPCRGSAGSPPGSPPGLRSTSPDPGLSARDPSRGAGRKRSAAKARRKAARKARKAGRGRKRRKRGRR